MDVQIYLSKMQQIYNSFIEFLDNDDSVEESNQNLKQLFIDHNIFKDKHEFKTIMHCISKISNYYFRRPNFFPKIEQVILILKPKMIEFFSNYEIYEIFKRNKRILLFLIKEKIVKIDESIYSSLTNKKNQKYDYFYYLYPEIKKIKDEKTDSNEQNDDKNKNKDELINNNEEEEISSNFENEEEDEKEKFVKKLLKESPEKFYKKRNEGENDDYICELIRNDSIEDFIIFVNKNDYSLKSQIKPSIFETNPDLFGEKNNVD